MLIPFQKLIDVFGIDVHGVLHIGAHECEEQSAYLEAGVPFGKIVWVEAQSNLVKKAKLKYPNIRIYEAVLSDQAGVKRNFMLTNNVESSSLLELKEHLIEHPQVHTVHRFQVTTKTIPSMVEEFDVDMSGLNFINIDIQGHELSVLKGMGDMIHQFDYLYLEVNTRELYSGCALLSDIDEFLTEKGYIRKAIEMTSHGWGDALYVKKALDFKFTKIIRSSIRTQNPE